MHKQSILEVIDNLLESYYILENELGKLGYPTRNASKGIGLLVEFYDSVTYSLELSNLDRELEMWQEKLESRSISFDDSLELSLKSVKTFLLSVRTRFAESEVGTLISTEQFDETRGYFKRLVEEINGCYVSGYYNACLVIIRRLIEILIIECFERKKIESKIINSSGNFIPLTKMIPIFFGEDKNNWNLSRNNKQRELNNFVLKKCHPAAHHRNYTSKLSDIQRFESAITFFVSDAIRIAFD